ncbi:MAG: hypothetical protein ABIG60_05435 [Patescibacteria group bacterium]
MKHFFSAVNKKINGLIWTLVSTGVIMLILGVLIVWTDFVLRLLVGLLVIVVAYVFLFAAIKIWGFKKEINKFIK